MITKDDIERLRYASSYIRSDCGEDMLMAQAIDNAIAHLDQPYQYDELIDVTVIEDFSTFATASYIASTQNDDVVVEFGDGEIKRFHYHRPIPQTVNVALDKEIKEAAKIGNQNMSIEGELSLEDQEILMARKFVCNAIASQEGGE